MNTWAIIISIIDIVICLALIAVIVMQEGNSRGLGALTGGLSDTHYSQGGSKGKAARLKSLTRLLAIVFAVLTVVLYLITGRGA